MRRWCCGHCAFALVLLALTRPVWHAATRDISVVYALDVSRSVAPAFVESALEWIRGANRSQAPATARYVVFAERPCWSTISMQLPKLAVTLGRGCGQPVRFSRAPPISRRRWTRRCSASMPIRSSVWCC